MANAYICDCCANFYTHTEFKQSIPVVDLDGDEIFIAMVTAENGRTVHLCPKCRAAWQKAWDRRAVHKTTDPEHVDKKCTLYDIVDAMTEYGHDEEDKK